MSGQNGKALPFPPTERVGAEVVSNIRTPMDLERLGMALIPFTPVPFRGEGAVWAWARLGDTGRLRQ